MKIAQTDCRLARSDGPRILSSGMGNRLPATIHVDIDGGAHVFRAHKWLYERDDDPLFETGLRRALDFFGQTGMRATFFVIAEDLDEPRKRELLAEAVRRGHEIASHSLTHSRLTALTRDEKRREIAGSRERLERELGVAVRGFRAPGFDMDRESLELIDAAGYDYDSSLFASAGRAHSVAGEGLNAMPHHPVADRRLMELPLPSHRLLPFPFHPCYSLVLGTWYFRLGLRLFQRTHAPFVLLFHLTDFADPLPQDLLPGPKARVYTLSLLSSEAKLRRCERMLELVKREYELVATAQLLEMQAQTGNLSFTTQSSISSTTER